MFGPEGGAVEPDTAAAGQNSVTHENKGENKHTWSGHVISDKLGLLYEARVKLNG